MFKHVSEINKRFLYFHKTVFPLVRVQVLCPKMLIQNILGPHTLTQVKVVMKTISIG